MLPAGIRNAQAPIMIGYDTFGSIPSRLIMIMHGP